jgi:proline dehydrogenase
MARPAAPMSSGANADAAPAAAVQATKSAGNPTLSVFTTSLQRSLADLPPPLLEPGFKPVLDFSDTGAAYKIRSTFELQRAWVVYKLCSVNWIARNAAALRRLSNVVLTRRLTREIIRRSFFAHFCAGENAKDIVPSIELLRQAGVGSILDYAAEADVGSGEHGALDPEEKCERNFSVFLDCIHAAAQFESNGFAAIKMTALGQPELLQRMTTIIRAVRDMFQRFDKARTQRIDFDTFSSVVDELGVKISKEFKRQIFGRFDKDKSGDIDFLEWTEFLAVEDLHMRPFFTAGSSAVLPALTDEELTRVLNMNKRLDKLAAAAAERKVRLMVDAEQSYFQPAIAHTVVNMQRKYNRDFPVIFTTYQAYTRDAIPQIVDDLDRCRREGFWFAGKLVRGAYLKSERELAAKNKTPSPLWDTIEETHRSYHYCVDLVFQHIERANIMVATHNQFSVEYATALMSKLKIDKKDGGVFFGQLMGMSDHLTMILGQSGYNAFKYVPYGPVDEVIPYLIRRAEENSGVVGGSAARAEMARLDLEIRKRRAEGTL